MSQGTQQVELKTKNEITFLVAVEFHKSSSGDLEDLDEEELLRRAIAMSLQDEEDKEIHFSAGKIKTAQILSSFVEKREKLQTSRNSNDPT